MKKPVRSAIPTLGLLVRLSLLVAATVLFPAAGATTCYTYCVGAVQFECGTNRPFGACIGTWGCGDRQGAHVCLGEAGGDVGNPATCKNDGECPPGHGCATWAFKKNECVKKCDADSDCPSDQKCRKPVGTGFRRCT